MILTSLPISNERNFEFIGIYVTCLKSIKWNVLSFCIESGHAILLEHINSHSGIVLIERLIEPGWFEKYEWNRFRLNEKSEERLESLEMKIKQQIGDFT